MKLAIAVGALVVGLALRPANSASTPNDLIGTFVQLCGEPSGDASTALARADALSWKMPPKTIPPPPTLGGAVWSNLQGRVRRSEPQPN